ncbi:MAG: hypothetical protein AMJ91_00465 [candidate division Zixibacteria bacterium SM23_73_3]|nr:MAG: hypothetical protein AMJ91_00465 [candidate division Zixibacteria bacterium SM23_73_3]
MKHLSLLMVLISVLLVHGPTNATIIHVPADSSTIQGGINGAENGDTVLVAPDTYGEHINFLGKAILLKSEAGPEVTVIERSKVDVGLSIVSFINGEDSTSIIDGFTIQNAILVDVGGGILCWGHSSPTIINNIIKNNSATLGGGVYAFSYSSPHIYDNQISWNTAETGGGILCDVQSQAVIIGNQVMGNEVTWRGGGVHCYDGCNVTVYDNVVADNSAYKGGGIFYEVHCSGRISKNSVYNNYAVIGGGIYTFSYSSPSIDSNTIRRNRASVGGGILVDVLSDPSITYNLILHNPVSDTGGGIYCYDQCSPVILDNTLYGNSALYLGGGILCREICSPQITNNIISNVGQGHGIFCELNSLPTISYNDIWGNIAGNYYGCEPGEGDISEDPLFCDPVNENYYLFNISPCVGAGQGGSNIGAFGVGCYAGYAVQVYAGPDVYGFAGATIEAKFYVKNVGLNPDAYTLEASDSLGWNVYPETEFITLDPEQGDTVIVFVEIGNLPETVDKVSLSATSQGDPFQSDSDFLYVTALYLCGDVNLTGDIDLGDVLYLVNYLYKGGPPPCEPKP